MGTARDNQGVTYGALIAEALTRYPSREAFVSGSRRLTYAEVADLTGRFITALDDLGVGVGSAVAMVGPNTPESWIVQAATYLLGAHFSGLQLLGSVDDHVFVCDDAQVTVLVAAAGFADHAGEVMTRAPSVQHVLEVPASGGINVGGVVPRPANLAALPIHEEAIAWLQYTGGTAGRPKGVMLSHRAMVQQTLSFLASGGLPEEPRYLAASPITHAAVLPVVPTLLRGGTIILQPSFDPDEWLRMIQNERVNYALAVPTMLYAVLDAARPEAYDLSSLQTVLYGAAPMSPARMIEALDRVGQIFQQMYGQTENVGIATALRRDEHDAANVARLSSCGKAVEGAEVAVLDEDGNPAAAGEVGELSVRSRAAMLGYRNLPQESAAVMRDGWLLSGDMARQDDDGFFYIVDRKKDMVVSGGFNIYAREVEDVLATHPFVAAAAIIGIPHDKWGEALHGFVVPRPGQRVASAELIAFVKERKGSVYAPKSLDVVDALPTTTVGKVDKSALRAPYWSGHARQVH